MTKDEALKKAQVFIDYHAKHWNGLEESPQELSDAINKALAQHDSVQEKKSTLTPKFVRIIDGVTCISLVEHEHIVNSLSQPEQTNIERHEANVQKFLGAPQPEQEPVAWRFTGIAGLKRYMTQKQYDAQTPEIKKWYEPFKCKNCTTPPQPEQEPVAWPHKYGCRANAFGKCDMGCTTPPQRKPLTQDGTMEIANQTAGQYWMDEAHIQRFRAAVEAAHGIKE